MSIVKLKLNVYFFKVFFAGVAASGLLSVFGRLAFPAFPAGTRGGSRAPGPGGVTLSRIRKRKKANLRKKALDKVKVNVYNIDNFKEHFRKHINHKGD